VVIPSAWDEEGFPSIIGIPPPTAKRIYRVACDRDWRRAEKNVVIGDGADWNFVT
jgi:hypothetical protein